MTQAMAPGERADKTRLREEYDALAPFFDAARSHLLEGIIPFVLSNLPKRKDKALDVGCAAGQLLRSMAPAFGEVWGVDLSPQMLQEARRINTGRPNVRLQEMDAEALTFADGTFDFVVGIAVLHHIDRVKGVREAARVLKPGGRLLFMGPSRGGPVKTPSAAAPGGDQGGRVPRGPRWWVQLTRTAPENLRLARALGIRNLLLWKRLWKRLAQAQTLLTYAQWLELAGILPGSTVGHHRYYAYVMWDKPVGGNP